MIGARINQAKGLFFDRDAVLKRTTAAERRALSKFGAFVRSDARNSIRRAPKKAGGRGSPPGRPPYNRTGLLKRFIFFVYDPDRHSVVIGPAKLNKPSDNAVEVLEHGGATTILTRRRDGSKSRRRARIDARPYMQPAFDKNRSKAAGLWRNQVKR